MIQKNNIEVFKNLSIYCVIQFKNVVICNEFEYNIWSFTFKQLHLNLLVKFKQLQWPYN